MIIWILSLAVVTVLSVCVHYLFSRRNQSNTSTCNFASGWSNMPRHTDAENKFGVVATEPWFHNVEMTRQIHGPPIPFVPPPPQLTPHQIKAEIAELEAVLLDFEDRYPSVQADAEVTGDLTEIRTLDESYGDTEEAIQNYRDQLDAEIKKDNEGTNETERLIDDVFGGFDA